VLVAVPMHCSFLVGDHTEQEVGIVDLVDAQTKLGRDFPDDVWYGTWWSRIRRSCLAFHCYISTKEGVKGNFHAEGRILPAVADSSATLSRDFGGLSAGAW
jgi:hypothetical protein